MYLAPYTDSCQWQTERGDLCSPKISTIFNKNIIIFAKLPLNFYAPLLKGVFPNIIFVICEFTIVILSTTSRELLSQFSTCSGWRRVYVGESQHPSKLYNIYTASAQRLRAGQGSKTSSQRTSHRTMVCKCQIWLSSSDRLRCCVGR